RKLFFIQRQSAGIRAKKRNSVRRNILHGKQFSAVTQLRMAVTSRLQIGSAMKRPPAATASSFGGKVLSLRQAEKSSQKVRWIEKRLSRPTSNGIASTNIGRTGHFCATGAGMLTRELSNGCSIPSFILSRNAVTFRHENNSYILRRAVRFRCPRARAGCPEGDCDFGAESREPGCWHAHVHQNGKRSASGRGHTKPDARQAWVSHS